MKLYLTRGRVDVNLINAMYPTFTGGDALRSTGNIWPVRSSHRNDRSVTDPKLKKGTSAEVKYENYLF